MSSGSEFKPHPNTLHTIWIESARAVGFPLASSVDLDLAWEAIQKHIQKYDDWVSKGYAGSMEYLIRGRDRRANPRLVFPEAQSVLCVGLPYTKVARGSKDPSVGPRYARYLHGEDYHRVITEKLTIALERVNALWSPSSGSPPLRWKICVDTSALLERSWAALAGMGWIGKNTLLIHPQYGSYFFIGIALVNHPTGRAPIFHPDYCGNCARCLNACPTQAFPEAHTLNSNRCISYLTLEKRGELPLDFADRTRIATWIAGCDLCQEVCPFNRKPEKTELAELAEVAAKGTNSEIPSGGSATDLSTWRHLLEESPEAFRMRVRQSSMNRIKPAQFSRNLAIGLANGLALGYLKVQDFPLEMVSLIQARYRTEADPVAQAEWARCVRFFEKPE